MTTVNQMLAAEFSDLALVLPPAIGDKASQLDLDRARMHAQAERAKRSAEREMRIVKAAKEYTLAALPGVIACTDSILANPEEIARQAKAIGRALAEEFERLGP